MLAVVGSLHYTHGVQTPRAAARVLCAECTPTLAPTPTPHPHLTLTFSCTLCAQGLVEHNLQDGLIGAQIAELILFVL